MASSGFLLRVYRAWRLEAAADDPSLVSIRDTAFSRALIAGGGKGASAPEVPPWNRHGVLSAEANFSEARFVAAAFSLMNADDRPSYPWQAAPDAAAEPAAAGELAAAAEAAAAGEPDRQSVV